MALATLSPWPPTTSAATRQAARDCLEDSLPEEGLDDDRLDALGEAASAVIERFAPDAPQAVKNESVIRLAGYLLARKARAMQSVSVGSIRVNFREPKFTNNLFDASGARALLLPWRTRRALPIEETS